MSDDLRAQLSLSLGRNYILEHELEGSGSSRIFVAKELVSDRAVVVKVLSAVVSDGVSAERFAREVHLAGTLQEPHTLPILGTGQTAGGLLYCIMPLVRAQTLRERLAEAPIGFDDAVTALRDVARAMDHAHRLGIVHGDIEPGKVFLLKGTAVITDFGIAKALELARSDSGRGPRLRLVPTGRGAAGYMAPEHASSDSAADHRADIYAWGVMAYEVLSDGHPFADITSDEGLLAAHVSEPVPMMLHKRYGVPERLATLVMRCLAKDPADRPESAAELLEVLNQIPLGATALVMEGKTAARWIGASIALAFGLFVAGAVALWRLQAPEAAEPPILAVLAFENTGAISDSLFPIGLEMGVRQKLAQLTSLRVIDKSSSRFVANNRRFAIESGKTLGADYVLTTSLRWFHDVDGTALVQVSPSVLHVGDGKVKWTGSPAIVSPADPFAAQAVLATQVAQSLGLELTTDEKTSLATTGTSDTAAYTAYVKGLDLYYGNVAGSSQGFAAAAERFTHASAIDPRFADAIGACALALTRVAALERTPALVDSAARLSRIALSLAPRQLAALTAASVSAFLRNRPEEAIGRFDASGLSISSDADALALHMSLMLYFRDSAAAWHDVDRIIAVAPKNVDALLAAASTAVALRRLGDAHALLDDAHALAPNRGDVALQTAELDRAEGKVPRMIQSVRAFLVLQPLMPLRGMPLMRIGDDSMQLVVGGARPETFGVRNRGDSVTFYIEKAKLFLTRRDSVRAGTLLDTAATLLRNELSDPRLHEWTHFIDEARLRWVWAARGDVGRALSASDAVQASLPIQRWHSGRYAAFLSCNETEIYGLAGQFTQVLTNLRRCLTLPGGYTPGMIATEPALSRFTTDPRLHALLQELGIENTRMQ